jgi:hypothetical protein
VRGVDEHTETARDLLARVKANLLVGHYEDDELILGYIRAALDYAESYQKVSYSRKPLPPSTEQAVVMLASHFYESRDGSTGGFFADSTAASGAVWAAVKRLLDINKNYHF